MRTVSVKPFAPAICSSAGFLSSSSAPAGGRVTNTARTVARAKRVHVMELSSFESRRGGRIKTRNNHKPEPAASRKPFLLRAEMGIDEPAGSHPRGDNPQTP